MAAEEPFLLELGGAGAVQYCICPKTVKCNLVMRARCFHFRAKLGCDRVGVYFEEVCAVDVND